MKLPRVQVWITTHDRPKYCLQTVKSALAMTYPNFYVTVSDNSSDGDDRTRYVFNKFKHPNLQYIRREPMMFSADHTAKCIKETETRYFVIFHDDDIFIKNFLDETVKVMLSGNYAAVGTNNFMMYGDHKTTQENMEVSGAIMVWRDHLAMLDRMVKKGFHFSPHPFAMIGGHLFNTDKVSQLRPNDSEGGKYSDKAFLAHVCQSGGTAWIMRPLWYCRQHYNQDGFDFSYSDAMLCVEHYRKEMGLRRDSQWIAQLRSRLEELRDNNVMRKALANECSNALKLAVEKHGKITIFPCGQHTKRILYLCRDSFPKSKLVICDDDPNAFANLGKRGYTCVLGSNLKRRSGYGLLSSDNRMISDGLRKRANKLFGVDGWQHIYDLTK